MPAQKSAKEPYDELVLDSFIQATSNPQVVQLAESAPGAELLPTKHLFRLLRKTLSATTDKIFLFERPEGNLELRKQIAKRATLHGTSCSADEIIITSGGFESWNLCLRALTKPGDSVLVDVPTYFGVYEILKNLGLKAVEVPQSARQEIDFLKLKALLGQKKIAAGIFMPNFTKPYAPVMSDQFKADLVMLMAEHSVPIIEDDIYGDLHFNSLRSKALKSFDRTGLVLHCGSFSKTVSPGFRLSWVVNSKYQPELLRQKFLTSISAPTLQQHVMAEFLAQGGFDRHLRLVRAGLVMNMQRYVDCIEKYFPEGTRVYRPPVGPIMWVELPGGVSAVQVYRRALQKNIVVGAGPIFISNGSMDHLLRIPFSAALTKRIELALKSLGALILEELDASRGVST